LLPIVVTIDLFQFQGGVESYLVSNDQVVAEISDSLGLGAELYFNKKKVNKLQPTSYKEIRCFLMWALILKTFMQPLLIV